MLGLQLVASAWRPRSLRSIADRGFYFDGQNLATLNEQKEAKAGLERARKDIYIYIYVDIYIYVYIYIYRVVVVFFPRKGGGSFST